MNPLANTAAGAPPGMETQEPGSNQAPQESASTATSRFSGSLTGPASLQAKDEETSPRQLAPTACMACVSFPSLKRGHCNTRCSLPSVIFSPSLAPCSGDAYMLTPLLCSGQAISNAIGNSRVPAAKAWVSSASTWPHDGATTASRTPQEPATSAPGPRPSKRMFRLLKAFPPRRHPQPRLRQVFLSQLPPLPGSWLRVARRRF